MAEMLIGVLQSQAAAADFARSGVSRGSADAFDEAHGVDVVTWLVRDKSTAE
jgi:hypothetical protein